MTRTEAIAEVLLEHTFTEEGECVCGWVGHGPRTVARHVAEQVEAVLS